MASFLIPPWFLSLVLFVAGIVAFHWYFGMTDTPSRIYEYFTDGIDQPMTMPPGLPSDLQSLCTMYYSNCKQNKTASYCNSQLQSCVQVMIEASTTGLSSSSTVYNVEKQPFQTCYKDYSVCTTPKPCAPGLGTSCNLTKDVCRSNFVSCVQKTLNNPGDLSPPPFISTPPVVPPPPLDLGSIQTPTGLLGQGIPTPPIPPLGPMQPTSIVNAGYSEYTPNRTIQQPDEMPKPYYETYIPRAKTDFGTRVESILADSSITPSLRQNIRNELDTTLSKEMNRINNEYEVDYVYI